jgi:hypothetical protein
MRWIAENDSVGASTHPTNTLRLDLFYLIIVRLSTGALDDKMAWGSVIWAGMEFSGGIAAW